MAEPAPPATRVLLPLLAMLAAMAAFQGGAAAAKQLFPAVGPIGTAGLRVPLAALMLLVVARPWRAWPPRAALAPILGLGACTGGSVMLFFMAIERLPLGIAVAVQFLGSLAVAILGSRRLVDLVWAALAGAGVWALAADQTSGPIDPLGLACALGAGAGWAGYILLGRRTGATRALTAASIATCVAALVAGPFGYAAVGRKLFDPALLPIGLTIAALSTVLPFTLELYALPRLQARTFAVFSSLEPAFAVLSGLVFLGERLTLVQTAGVAMVMTAAAGAAWSHRVAAEALSASVPGISP